tara:strand:- start:833 stop:1240 length:408 start_codon:yes stop_codon:yes gene_type:complete
MEDLTVKKLHKKAKAKGLVGYSRLRKKDLIKFIKNSTGKKKKSYFKTGYDLYSDKNPKDTIRIKYDTIKHTKETIKKLERLYKSKKYSHKRIVQVVNVMVQRLRVIFDRTGKGKTRLKISKAYMKKLKKRTKSKS